MKLKIEINMDNAAFEDNPDELTDMLTTVGNRVTGYGEKSGNIMDSNGNTVGKYAITGK